MNWYLAQTPLGWAWVDVDNAVTWPPAAWKRLWFAKCLVETRRLCEDCPVASAERAELQADAWTVRP